LSYRRSTCGRSRVRMRERECFPATILARSHRLRRPRHPYAVPRTSLQSVCTQRRNCIEQLPTCPKYAPGAGPFPARRAAIFKLKISCLAAILAVEAIDLDQTGAAKPDASPKAMRQNIDWVTIFMWVWVAGLVWLALTILWAMAPG
jgi:hypothetical protein